MPSSKIEEAVQRQYPYPIASAYADVLRNRRGKESFQRSWSVLLDLHEVLVRFLSLAALSSYLERGAFSPAFNERLRQILIKNLSLGDWVTLLRETLRAFHTDHEAAFAPELVSFYFGLDGNMTDAAQILERFVNLRNETRGHMLTLSEGEYRRLYDQYLPLITNVLKDLGFLSYYQLLVCTDIDNDHIRFGYDCTGASDRFQESPLNLTVQDARTREYQAILVDRRDVTHQLALYPLYFVEDDPVNEVLEIMLLDGLKFAKDLLAAVRFLAIRRRAKVTLSLDVIRDNPLLRDFQVNLASVLETTASILESAEAASRAYYFASQYDLIETYLATFVGRVNTLRAFTQFCESHPRGVYLVLGAPGQGKSALAAKIIKETGAIHHFIAGDEGRNVEKYILQSLLFQMRQRYELTGRMPDNEDDLRRALSATLQDVSVICAGEHRKEYLVLDGLDELMVTNQGVRLDFLPNPLPPNIYVLITSRPIEVVGALGNRVTRTYELEPLTLGEVEAIVRADVPDMPVRAVTRIFQQSRGNPLYVRCVINEIREGELKANALPGTIEGLFRNLMYALHTEGHELPFDVLGILTIAYEGLNANQLEAILHYKKRDILYGGIRRIRTFLTVSQGRYRVFHKSMRDFLTNQAEEYAFEASDLERFNRSIIEACRGSDLNLQRYAVQYLPSHLYDINQQDEIVRLSTMEQYVPAISDLLVNQVRQLDPLSIQGSTIDSLLSALAENDSDAAHAALLGFFERVVHYGYLEYCREFARTSATRAATRGSESQWVFTFAEARIAQVQGDLKGASELLALLEPHISVLGNHQLPQFLFIKAETQREGGEYATARETYEACRAALARDGDPFLLLDTLLHLGDLEYVRGELGAAITTLTQALALAEDQRILLMVGQSHRLIGHVQYVREDYQDALVHYHQALDMFARLDDQVYLGRIYTNLAETYAPIDLDRAFPFADSAVSLNSAMGYRLELGKALFTRSDIARLQHRFEDAVKDADASISELTSVGHFSGLARAFRVKALILVDEGKLDEALNALDQSDQIFERIAVYPTFVFKNLLTRLDIYQAQGDADHTHETTLRLEQMASTSEIGYLFEGAASSPAGQTSPQIREKGD